MQHLSGLQERPLHALCYQNIQRDVAENAITLFLYN
jgi:hypothetical protein